MTEEAVQQARLGGGYSIAADEQEFKQRLLLGDQSTADQEEINAATATGFLNKKEIDFIRELQSNMAITRFIENELGITLKKCRNFFLELINYIAHSSGSKGGAAVQAGISKILVNKQDIAQHYSEKQEEKEGMIDKIRKVGGRLQNKGSGFGSDMQYMNYDRKRPWED